MKPLLKQIGGSKGFVAKILIFSAIRGEPTTKRMLVTIQEPTLKRSGI
jgi:hypothetical protein